MRKTKTRKKRTPVSELRQPTAISVCPALWRFAVRRFRSLKLNRSRYIEKLIVNDLARANNQPVKTVLREPPAARQLTLLRVPGA